MSETQRVLGADGLATLKELALLGALDGEEKLSCSALAERLDASTQTASRRLQQLDELDCVERDIVSDGQWVQITSGGERRLQAEYADYRRLFEQDTSVSLTGDVTSGMGEGRHYITLSGYMEQFRDLLGYEPFAGTFNIDLTEESIRRRAHLGAIDPVVIEGWEDDERTYGPAYCYPATVVADERYEPAHVIAPERTHHGDDHLEVIAPDRLRDTLGLDDGDEVTVDVEQR
ncbi:CTP-dependent riboflavin kinase [Salinibaculum rarum]|uniref:CTP-dependent riboflavin kinase n=1 Tax=Salinibaculum rarum TaxID=3058903 RepID=UPI00265D7ECD|nr:CTP-dependent riboflavin kinase [Salinibaculum sp. KK48]